MHLRGSTAGFGRQPRARRLSLDILQAQFTSNYLHARRRGCEGTCLHKLEKVPLAILRYLNVVVATLIEWNIAYHNFHQECAQINLEFSTGKYFLDQCPSRVLLADQFLPNLNTLRKLWSSVLLRFPSSAVTDWGPVRREMHEDLVGSALAKPCD